MHRFLPNRITTRHETNSALFDGTVYTALTQLPNTYDKLTLAYAALPTCNLSATRDTLVDVRFAVRAAHRFIVHRTNARTYAINQIHVFNAVFVARRVFFCRGTEDDFYGLVVE